MFRHLCSSLRAKPSLEKSAWSEDSLIQSLFPADRQLVCNSSMLSPWAMDFFGLLTCWVCGYFSTCTCGWGHTLKTEDVVGRVTVQFSFSNKDYYRVKVSPGKAFLAVRFSSFGIYSTFLPKLFISFWQTPWSA